MNANHEDQAMNGIGPVFALVGVVERDVQLGSDRFTLRIELFRAQSQTPRFRARIWGAELFRLQSSFPQREDTGEPADPPSDELVLVDYSYYLKGDYSDFAAENQDAAIKIVSDDLEEFLTRMARPKA